MGAAGRRLLAVRELHCAVKPWWRFISAALDHGDMVQITKAQCRSALSQDGP